MQVNLGNWQELNTGKSPLGKAERCSPEAPLAGSGIGTAALEEAWCQSLWQTAVPWCPKHGDTLLQQQPKNQRVRAFAFVSNYALTLMNLSCGDWRKGKEGEGISKTEKENKNTPRWQKEMANLLNSAYYLSWLYLEIYIEICILSFLSVER